MECRRILQTQLYTCNVEYIYICNCLFYTTRDATQKSLNFHTARKPLVVQLWAVTCREPPKRFVMCGSVCFFSTFFDVLLVLFCDHTDLLKRLMWKNNGFVSNYASNSARRQRKYPKCLKKNLVIIP